MLTRVLIVINVLVYLVEMTTGGPDASPIVARGLLSGRDVANGEWWRIVTSEFLHANLFHILTNMVALYQVGTFVELLYGPGRMAVLYLLAIAGAGAGVLWFNFDAPTLGASGAVFGLFGALLAAGLRLGKPGRDIVQQSAGVIILNLILGFTIFRFVSNAAHIGGMIAGFVFGYLLFMGPRYAAMQQAMHVEPEPVPVAPGQVYEPAPPHAE